MSPAPLSPSFAAIPPFTRERSFPALFSLTRRRHLADNAVIVGYARDEFTNEKFRQLIFRSIYDVGHPNSERLDILSRISYVQGQVWCHLYPSLAPMQPRIQLN